MEKERGTRIIALAALCIAVVGVSIGFATFARQFTITGTDTTIVEQGEDVFANGGLYLTTTDGTITAETTWSGLTGTITDANRTITYTATINNTTSYDAYLSAVSSNSGKLVCTAVTPAQTNDDTVQAACNKLTLTLAIGDTYSGNITKAAALSSSGLNDGTRTVDASSTETITLTLTLANDAVMPDGDFTVTIPGITFDYTSLKAN